MEHIASDQLDRQRAALRKAGAPAETERTHPLLFWLVGGAFGWILLAAFAGFGEGAESWFMLIVAALLLAVGAGVPLAIAALRRRSYGLPPSDAYTRWRARPVQTASGPIRGREALLQAAAPPVALAVAMTLIAVVAGLAG